MFLGNQNKHYNFFLIFVLDYPTEKVQMHCITDKIQNFADDSCD